ncbi:MAG: hypothetical protein N3B11_04480 [Coriobacteriia bacterium]|nr:hypothetical protein [Coriobacteriia bacterium]
MKIMAPTPAATATDPTSWRLTNAGLSPSARRAVITANTISTSTPPTYTNTCATAR